MESSDSEEDYGLIRPSLIKQLRSVLDQYPDDGQILKEVIQNAEDAGATEVKFLYDEHSFPTNDLHDPGMAKFQGPALYSYNNATFDQEDWKGIRMLQASIKEKDPMKVGRFGLGFKSVLHMTDLPSVLSRDRLFVIDPHEQFFHYKDTPTSGYTWHLKKKERLVRCPDQFKPYMGVFGTSQRVFDNGYYDGTLFRFPLRSNPSELSSTIYDSQRVNALFQSFERDAHLMLLFLKNLEKIEIYRRRQGSKEPVLVYKVQLAEDCLGTVRKQRRSFKQKCQGRKGATSTYKLNVETVKVDGSRRKRKTCYSWLVTEHCAWDQTSSELKELCADRTLSLIPLVGVALDLNQQDLGSRKPNGQVFCFLPLPTGHPSPTGLPVHVNGYFAVDQNRRNLKWPAYGQAAIQDKAVQWNQCIMQELLPVAYAHLLKNATLQCEPSAVYSAMPNSDHVENRWKSVVKRLYEDILREEIIFTEARGGRWMTIDDVIMDRSEDGDETSNIVHQVLLQCDCNVSRVPRHVLSAVQRFSSKKTNDVTPSKLRAEMKKCPQSYTGQSATDKRRLLSYILGDRNYQDMLGLLLLPRADGAMVQFSNRGATIYIPTAEIPRELFPGLEKQLLAGNVDPTILSHLVNMARSESVSGLRELSRESASSLLQNVLPQLWRDHEREAMSTAGSSVPTEWFQHLWKYLAKVHPYDLSQFNKLHILPLHGDFSKQVVTLSSKVILKNAQGMNIPDSLEKMFKGLDVFVISNLPRQVQNHQCIVGNIAKIPSDGCMLEVICSCLSSMEHQAAVQFVENSTDKQKRALIELLSRVSSLGSQVSNLGVLRKMPFLPSTSVRKPKAGILSRFFGTESPKPVSIAGVSGGANLADLPCTLSVTFVDVSERVVYDAAKLLGLRMLHKKEILQLALLDAQKGLLEDATTQEVIEKVFNSIHKYSSDTEFMNLLGDIPFVTCGDNITKKPSELYDPVESEMRVLYSGKGVFPTGVYARPERLAYLRMMGLKSARSFSAKDALEQMKELHRHSSSMYDATSTEKATTILSILSRTPDLLDEKVQGGHLKTKAKNLSWVPVLQEKPSGYPASLAWKGGRSKFLATPGELLAGKWSLIAGSASLVAAVNITPLSAKMDFKEISLSLVLDHLNNIVKMYQAEDKAEYLGMIRQVYTHLAADVPSDELVGCLKKKNMDRWIWHGDGFDSVDSVYAEQLPFNLRPFIHTLPSEMLPYHDFFTECGMERACDCKGLVKVLQKIRAVHKNDTVDRQSLRQSIDILNTLKTNVESFSDEERQTIPVPIRGSTPGAFSMAELSKSCYTEEQWFQQDLDESDLAYDEIYLLHRDVPFDTAKELHVASAMSKLIPENDFGIESYGQSEPLTTRLKNLLDDYTDGLAIFKEMIQNADDAGATEVGFLYDERTNDEHRTRLLDPAMSECQGPALWVYNNEAFTDQDFQNIIRLGGGTKQSDADKIGKFGLGFNVVYNLTDVPSLLSRNHFAIFDPHQSHLRNATRTNSQPGIKVDLEKNFQLMKKVPDQFKPYKGIFECDISQSRSFPGTLFRLPLRTKTQAIKSEISNLHYSKSEMSKLFDLLAQNAHSLLLFTQNVSSLVFHHLHSDGESTESNKVLHLTKENVTDITLAQHEGRSVKISGRPSLFSVATQCMGSRQSKEDLSCSALIKTSTTFLDTGQFGYSVPPGPTEHNWLISGTVMTTKPCKPTDQGVPYGSVAVQLLQEPNGDFRPSPLREKSLVFCFLPLPVPSNLNIHINGTFAVSSSRQHLAVRSVDTKDARKAEWNEFLLQHVIKEAYVQCLLNFKELVTDNALLYDIWPHPSTHSDLQSLALSLFAEPHKLPFVIHDGAVVTLGKVSFLETENVQEDVAELALQTFKELARDQHITQLPHKVRRCLEMNRCENLLQEQVFSMERFIREVIFPHLDALPDDTRNRLVLYAIESNEKTLDELLVKTKCIQVSTGELKLAKELIDPRSGAARLYRKEEGRFPIEIFNQDTVLDRLKSLGMAAEVSLLQLHDRAESLHGDYERSLKAGDEKRRTLLKILSQLLESEAHDPDVIQKFQSCRILRAKKSPKDCSIPWKGDEETPNSLHTPQELFDQEIEDLVFATELVVEDLSKPLADNFGFRKDVDSKIIRSQLEHAIATSSKCPGKDRDAIRSVTHAIYNYLQERPEQFNQEDFDDMDCILVNNMFVRPSIVSLDEDLDIPPHLYKIPTEQRKYCEIMKGLGVREKFDAAVLVDLLRSFKENAQAKPLPSKDLEITLKICEVLAKKILADPTIRKGEPHTLRDIFVPNSKNIMFASQTVCFDDCEWLEGSNMNLVSPRMAPEYGKVLGVISKREGALKGKQEGIPFGPSEEITTSIRRIMENCSKTDVLKELIQNADDAGATEIHFIRDSRSHPDERVFSDSWKELQGPALCVYNNKPFTNKDLEGIQSVGKGSKQYDPCKTGHYGVGFCSVYHLTDVPSILTTSEETDTTLLVFDPCLKYVPGASVSKPGMRYQMQTLGEDFSDVLPCYLENNCDVRQGTMLRIPLRTEEMVATTESKISKEPVSMDELHEMLQDLKTECGDILLFANSLEIIKISDMKSDGLLQNIFTSELEMSDQDRDVRRKIKERREECKEMLEKSADPFADVSPQSYIYNCKKKVGSKSSYWCVSWQLGIPSGEVETPEDVVKAFENKKLNLMPCGSVACNARDDGLVNIISPTNSAFCVLPLSEDAGTGLPVHVNGQFALRHENRKQIEFSANDHRTKWNEFLLSFVIAQAYCNLIVHLRDVVDRLWKEESRPIHTWRLINQYTDVFPTIRHESRWNTLVKGVFKTLATQKAAVFLSRVEEAELEWFPIIGEEGKEVFLNPPTANDQKTPEHRYRPPSPAPEETLRDCGLHVIRVPPLVASSIVTCVSEAKSITPNDTVEILRSFQAENSQVCKAIGTLPRPIEETPIKSKERLTEVVKYCAKSESFGKNAADLPLMLTKDNQLRCFDGTETVFEPTISFWFPKQKHRFMDSDICNILREHECPNVESVTIASLGNLIQNEFPNLNQYTKVEWSKTFASCESNDDLPTEKWVEKIWSVIDAQLNPNPQKATDTEHGDCTTCASCEEQLTVLADIPLIPVYVQNEDRYFLWPVKDAHLVYCTSDTHHDQLQTDMLNLMIDEAIPILDIDKWRTKNQTLQNIVTNYKQVNRLLNLIPEQHPSDGTADRKTDTDASHRLLQYFQENAESIEPQARQRLQQLPLYETFTGQLTTISTFKERYTVPDSIPRYGLGFFENPATGCVFLKRREDLQHVYERIGSVKQIEEVKVYSDFILKHVEDLKPDDLMFHLKHLYDEYIKNESHDASVRNQIISLLKETPLFKCSNGEWKTASQLYDPGTPLFKTMFKSEDQFPPPCPNQFKRNFAWPSFLHKIGVIKALDADTFVKFAETIAEEGRGAAEEKDVRNNSELLVNHLYCRIAEPTRSQIIQRIRRIPFLLKEQMAGMKIAVHYGDSNERMMAFEHSVVSSHRKLVWTQANVLNDKYQCKSGDLNCENQKQRNEEKQRLHQALGVHESPPSGMVIGHFKVLYESLQNNQEFGDKHSGEITAAFREGYRYFAKNELFDMNVRDLPFVLVKENTRLVKADKVTLQVMEEIHPYLYKLPYEIGEWETLFLNMGSSKSATPLQYLSVLKDIYWETKGERLRPNQMDWVCRATKGFFSTSDMLSARTTPGQVLYLPTQSRRLADVTSLVINDAPGFYSRARHYELPVLMDLRAWVARIRYMTDILTMLPDQFHPRRLSKIVVEKLLEGQGDSARSCDNSSALEERLRSREFGDAINRLLTQESVDEDAIPDLVGRLQSVRVWSIAQLATELFIDGEKVPGSQMAQMCFLQKSQGSRSIYIKEGLSLTHLHVDIGRLINDMLDGKLRSSVLYLLPILTCRLHEIEQLLNGMNIGIHHAQAVTGVVHEAVVGAQIPPDELCGLREGEQQYETGELVAYRRRQGLPLIYSRFRAVVGQGNVEIDTPDGPKKVSKSSLLKF